MIFGDAFVGGVLGDFPLLGLGMLAIWHERKERQRQHSENSRLLADLSATLARRNEHLAKQNELAIENMQTMKEQIRHLERMYKLVESMGDIFTLPDPDHPETGENAKNVVEMTGWRRDAWMQKKRELRRS